MIIWGTRGDTMNLGNLGVDHCPICKENQEINLLLGYQWFHLYWFFSFITKKEYMAVCTRCGNGVKLDSKEIEEKIEKVPIPFMRRYGCLVLLGIVALAILVIIINGAGFP